MISIILPLHNYPGRGVKEYTGQFWKCSSSDIVMYHWWKFLCWHFRHRRMCTNPMPEWWIVHQSSQWTTVHVFPGIWGLIVKQVHHHFIIDYIQIPIWKVKLLSGIIFSEINECIPDPCQNKATCTNLVNDYNCTCVLGFNGTNCENSMSHYMSCLF